MSNFHRVKDRLPDGKAPPHHCLKYASRDGTTHIHHRDRYNYPELPRCNFAKNPSWWNNLHTTRRRRTDDRLNVKCVLHGADPDGIVWMPDRRPSEYFW